MDKNSERFKELRNKKVSLTPFAVGKITAEPIRAGQPASGRVDGILEKLGVASFDFCEEIQGGRDSQVYKIGIQNRAYALRLLPARKYGQFVQEKKAIGLARENGVPVPKVHAIETAGGYAAMLMEWGEGMTVMAALKERPELAEKLGIACGKTQARIHQIQVSPQDRELRSWLTPSREEAGILSAVPLTDSENVLLHLDFHPLNVLTDGRNVTAVLDWANAASGDCRFDLARTFSILELVGRKRFEKDPDVLDNFVKGWRAGCGIAEAQSMPLFYAWGGIRMKRDSEAQLDESGRAKIDAWVAGWLAVHRRGTDN
ncbi:phosphotransferase family protein [Planomicrobium sp. CPCC 101110]|uniref:phosphotransferase family protein n=1 Tax=Planomicrobium sp. CPCC 101110 TaxID=2599619 RepID=UPI0011B676DC|nr:aminoglycoside phosphotransferase family protein [Planomicrobium sp. CPCC 101110]TWT25328.1 aminoglycoside phosphotransferase family protein [Planomicrobium sp. CPCC 101110]